MHYDLASPSFYENSRYLQHAPDAVYGRIKSLTQCDDHLEICLFHTQSRDDVLLSVYFPDHDLLTRLKRGDVIAFRPVTPQDQAVAELVLLNPCTDFPSSPQPEPRFVYEQRELEVLLNPASMQTITRRDRIIHAIRLEMHDKGFCEVELPILKKWPDISPSPQFEVPSNGHTFYLRTTFPPVERLLAGFEQVYTLGQNFRRGDHSFKNLPEFTMFCMAAAARDYIWAARYVQSLFATVTQRLRGSTVIEIDGVPCDIGSWRWVSFSEAFRDVINCDILTLDSDEALRDECIRQHVSVPKPSWNLSGHLLKAVLFDALFEQRIVREFDDPVFFYECPWYLAGPAQPVENHPFLKERGEGYVRGLELMNAKSILVSASETAQWHASVLEQKRSLGQEEIAKRDPNFFMSVDSGLVPGALASFGVDRLVMLILGCKSVSDVVMYPLFEE